MQNKYEMLRMAICTVTSLPSEKLLILPNTFTREVLDLYFFYCMAHHKLATCLMAANSSLNSPLQGVFPQESRYR